MEGHGQGASDSRYAAVVAITGKRGRLHDRGGGSFHCSGENDLREAHLGIHLQSRDRCRVTDVCRPRSALFLYWS
jgi:hypothetical protein